MQRLACGRRMYEVIITLYCHMSLRPQNDGGDDDDDRSTTNQTNKQYTNTQRNKQASKQSSLPHTTNTILGLLHLKFFFPDFLRLLTSLRQEASSARSLRPLFTEDDRAEGPVAGGAARPVACATDEDAGPVADDIAEGPVAGGRCEACGLCWR